MSKIVEILDDIEWLCKHVTKGHELKDDLKQEVVLTILETYGDCERYTLDDLRKIAAKIIYTKWYTRDGIQEIGTKNVNSFSYLYRDFNELANIDIDEIRGLYEPEEHNEDTLNTLLKSNKLTSLEKDILREYVRRNCKVSQFSLDADVSRFHLNKRINEILKKCKEIL